MFEHKCWAAGESAGGGVAGERSFIFLAGVLLRIASTAQPIINASQHQLKSIRHGFRAAHDRGFSRGLRNNFFLAHFERLVRSDAMADARSVYLRFCNRVGRLLRSYQETTRGARIWSGRNATHCWAHPTAVPQRMVRPFTLFIGHLPSSFFSNHTLLCIGFRLRRSGPSSEHALRFGEPCGTNLLSLLSLRFHLANLFRLPC